MRTTHHLNICFRIYNQNDYNFIYTVFKSDSEIAIL